MTNGFPKPPLLSSHSIYVLKQTPCRSPRLRSRACTRKAATACGEASSSVPSPRVQASSFSLPHARPVLVKVGLVQAGSGSGLLTRRPLRPRVSQSPTVGASRGELRSAERRGQETLAEPRCSPDPPSSATAGVPVPDRRRVTWRAAVSRTAGSGDPRRTKAFLQGSLLDCDTLCKTVRKSPL